MITVSNKPQSQEEWMEIVNASDAKIVVIDLFCGAGGTTTGIHRAKDENGNPVANVIACVNHDENAIRSHEANYPHCIHFEEDLTVLNVERLPRKPEGCDKIWILWMSPDCTQHSKAKGGGPKNRDSRMLATQAFRYLEWIRPDAIQVENVTEFMDWGPLDENDRVIKERKGEYFEEWVDMIKAYGYDYQHQVINSADLGAYTARKRYFGFFANQNVPLVFPQPTHDKKGRFGLPKWKPVKEVLDLDILGESVFNRKKPLVDRTFHRLYKGLKKHYVGKNQSAWMYKYMSNSSDDGTNDGFGLDESCHTVTTQPRLYPTNAICIAKYNNSNGDPNPGTDLEDPASTLTKTCHQGLVHGQFVLDYRNKDNFVKEGDNPATTITTKNHQGLASVHVMNQFGQSDVEDVEKPVGTILKTPKQNVVHSHMIQCNSHSTMPKSVDEPASTLMTSTKKNLVHIESQSFIHHGQYGGGTRTTDKPCNTLIARMDKAPFYLIDVNDWDRKDIGYMLWTYPHLELVDGKLRVRIDESDGEYRRKLKEMMNQYGIVDITMRMLNLNELKDIQGFNREYVLKGTLTEKRKYIGNSVHPIVSEHWYNAIHKSLGNNPILD